jgi:hypothetical protein
MNGNKREKNICAFLREEKTGKAALFRSDVV